MSEGVRELKEKAQALLVKRRHRKALVLLEKVVKLAPDDVFSLKKLGEIQERLGENQSAAQHYLRLSSVYNKDGRRLQAITCCKLALRACPDHSAAQSLLDRLYSQHDEPRSAFQLEQRALKRGPVSPPHPGPAGQAPPTMPVPQTPASPPPQSVSPLPEAVAAERIPPAAVKNVETFVSTLLQLCASFSGTALTAAPQALAESVTGHTDFLWLIQFTGAVEHTVVISAQRRFVFGLTQRVLDLEESMVTAVMATKLSNKLMGMYASDVKRAFATNDLIVQSGPPIPIAGENATYQLSGTRALHVPLSSDIGWVQVTVAGGI